MDQKMDSYPPVINAAVRETRRQVYHMPMIMILKHRVMIAVMIYMKNQIRVKNHVVMIPKHRVMI